MASTQCPPKVFQVLNVAVIGAGPGGLCAALSLRRAGHQVTLYERYGVGEEVGAGVSTASNGSRFLQEWDVDVAAAKPVVLKQIVAHDWITGEVKMKGEMGDYKARFGFRLLHLYATSQEGWKVYGSRVDIRRVLLQTCTQESGLGSPCKVVSNNQTISVSPEEGVIKFSDGSSITADLVIGADGIRSKLRTSIGIVPEITDSGSCYYQCVFRTQKLQATGWENIISGDALEFWGLMGINKIVLGPCSNGEVIALFGFCPAAHNGVDEDGWNISATPQEMIDKYPKLDNRIKTLISHAESVKTRRLFSHQAYPYWTKGVVGLIGDAAHPMLPHQAQGFGQAIEDAGYLGLVFGKECFDGDVVESLKKYETVRKERVTKIQDASLRGATDLKERIGWKTANDRPGKMTIEELCGYDMGQHVKKLYAGESSQW